MNIWGVIQGEIHFEIPSCMLMKQFPSEFPLMIELNLTFGEKFSHFIDIIETRPFTTLERSSYSICAYNAKNYMARKTAVMRKIAQMAQCDIRANTEDEEEKNASQSIHNQDI